MTVINQSLEEKIIALRKQGLSYRKIEKKLGCSRGSVAYHCEKNGLADIGNKKVALTESLKLEIAEYCKMNFSFPMYTNILEDAAKYFGLHRSTIFNYKDYQGKMITE